MLLETFFSDLKVVELASVLAGPAVGMFFAELGADVHKLENRSPGGDVTRRWRLPQEPADRPRSAYYCSGNWRKETLLLDLRAPADHERVLELIREADVLISNFKLPSAAKLKMDYDTLRALTPRLIYAQLTSFGAGVDRPAFDVVLQAEAGFLYMCGEPDRDPVKMPVALIDLLAAHQLKDGILLALIHRMRTGRGSYVSSSLLEAAVASLANQATNWLMAGHLPQPMGTRHPNIAPYGDMFRTRDGKSIILAVGTEKQFAELCAVLGLSELPADPRFASNHQRGQHREALQERLTPAVAQWSREQLLDQLHQRGVPVGSIRNMAEVFELDTARAMILEEEMANGERSQRVRTVAFQLQSPAD